MSWFQSLAWSVYDGEWGTDPSVAVDMPPITRAVESCTLRGSGLRKRHLIKRGAQGAVYAALDSQGQEFAVKRLFTQSNDFGTHGISETVLREATILHHVCQYQQRVLQAGPNAENPIVDASARIINLHHIVEAPHREWCLVMELCAMDLVQVLLRPKRTGQLGTVLVRSNAELAEAEERPIRGQMPLVRYLMRRILRMVAFLHDTCGVMHRDLKLSNILVTEDGALRLSDFGSSRLMDGALGVTFTSNPSAAATYTPASCRTTMIYQAPECLLGNCQYTSAVDIWSCGVIFAEILRQSHLFVSSSELGLVSAIWKLLGKPSPRDCAVGEGSVKVQTEPEAQATLPLKFNRSVVTEEGFTLLQQMLSIDPARRPTVAECLVHPFLAFAKDAEDDMAGKVVWMETVRSTLDRIRKPVSVQMSALGMGDDTDEESGDGSEDVGRFDCGIHIPS